MCNNCIHAPVCGKCKATGGQVGKCEHFAEERKGRWIRNDSTLDMECSVCGRTLESWFDDDARYCPNCGARMDGDPHA